MKRSSQQHEQLAQIVEKVNDLSVMFEKGSRPAEETILDDVALCELLHVSKRTTSTWRELGMIKHSIIRNKIFYLYSDVLLMIKHYAVPTLDGSLKIKLRKNSN